MASNIFNNNSKFAKFLFLKLILLFFIIKENESKSRRSDNERLKEATTIFNFIQSNFSVKDVIYQEKFSDYNISVKFLNIEINDKENINLYYGYEEIFSLRESFIEFILSLNITNNNDFKNNPDNQVSIIFNNNIKEPVLKFQLKHLYAKIDFEFIEFYRDKDETYNYSFYYDKEDFKKKVRIFIDINNYKYFPKIYKFLNENKEKIEIFLFNSFCNYLNDILNEYPEPSGLTLYKNIVDHILTVKTIGLEMNNLEKAIIYEFKEENHIKDGYVKILNIKYKMDLLFYNNSKIEEEDIIPEIGMTSNFYVFNNISKSIDNIPLEEIFKKIFDKIMTNYID